jgi:site-specific recombinase XerD
MRREFPDDSILKDAATEDRRELVATELEHGGLPPIIAGNVTAATKERVERFYASVEAIFEAWVTRRKSHHTQRAYRDDVMQFVRFAGIKWPEEDWRLFAVSVRDVMAWRKSLLVLERAPKTLNRRISSLSSFYKYLAATAAELRLPITVPNPAHAQFIARESSDPLEDTRALTPTRARQLMGLPSGDSLLEARDRAILKLALYTGARIGTLCRLRVKDFLQDGDEATIRLNEKGDKHRTIGIHFAAAEALGEYVKSAGLETGPLFRARRAPKSEDLGEKQISPASMYRLIGGYLERLPGALKEDGCIYTPHSLRATTATLLLDAGVDIMKVRDLLGHRHVTTTQIYDKRRRATKESASHDVPI